MKKLVGSLFCLAVLALAFPASATAVRTCSIDLEVTGMTCPNGCVKKVHAALTAVKNVAKVNVSFEKSLATVDANQTLCSDPSPLVAALKKVGFSAKVKANRDTNPMRTKTQSLLKPALR